MKFEIDLNDDLVDRLVVETLRQTRDSLIEDRATRKAGGGIVGFFSNDYEEDMEAMNSHIEACRVLLTYFTPYPHGEDLDV